MKTIRNKKVTVSTRHKWDVLEDMVVCSMVISGQMNDKKAVKRVCKMFNITETQLYARANNYLHLVMGSVSFWHTSKQERMVVDVLEKHDTVFNV